MKPETKTFAFKLDGPPDDEGRFSGYAAAFGNVDKGNDIIEPGAFTKTLQENPEVPILWQHDDNEPLGVSLSMVEDGKGLKVEGQLAMEVQRAREIHALMKLGAIKGLSIGYKTVKRNFKGRVRHLQELMLGEFSPCVFPMNDLATVNAVKGLKYGWPVSDEVQDVSCLLSMISAGVDFMDNEADEGDTDDVAAMQAILSQLTDLLAQEIVEVGEPDDDADENAATVDVEVYVEAMREPIELSIKKLQALLDREPVAATRAVDGAVEENAEPAIATLRDLASALKR